MQRDCSGRPLRLFLTFYRPHRRLFALDLLFSLLSCLADLAFPYVSRQAMQNLLPLGLFRTFFAIMAALLAAYLLKAVFKYAVTVIGHQCGVLIEADMRQELFEHLQTMSFRFFDCNRTGVLMSRMTSDLFSITELAHHGPEYLLTAVVTLGGALAILAPICWQLALVLLLLVPLSLWITIRQRKRMNDANVAVKRRQAEINTVIESGISGVRTAKAFTNEAVEREKFLACNDRYKHSKTDWYRAMGVFQGGMEFTMSAMQVVVIALGGAYIMRGQIDYIDLITFSLYVTTFISPIRTLVNFMEVFTDGTAGFQRFLELMRVQPDIADAPDARPLPTVRGQVDYNNVSFDYAEGATVLSHVDLHIAPGETLAVVGPSGGGKTTLCQLLPRFYDVTSGSVCIDGIDVRTVTQASLRRCVGVLQQEVFLFADTIRAGLADEVTADDLILCNENVWDTNTQAETNFFCRFAGRELHAQMPGIELPAGHGTLYAYQTYRNYGGYDLAWCGRLTDDTGEVMDGMRVYVQGALVPDNAVIKYKVRLADGTEEPRQICLLDCDRTPRNEKGEYIATVEDTSILNAKVMIWDG